MVATILTRGLRLILGLWNEFGLAHLDNAVLTKLLSSYPLLYVYRYMSPLDIASNWPDLAR